MLRRSLRLWQAASASMPRPKDRNPYAILGMSNAATDAQLKDKFKSLARKHHPDMPHGSASKFREINAAYQIIKTERASAKRMKETGSEQDPNSAKYNYRRPAYGEGSTEAEAEAAQRAHFTSAGDQGLRYNSNMFFWTTDAFEYVLTIISVSSLVLYAAHRSLVRFETATSDRYGKLAELEKLQAGPLVSDEDVADKLWREDMPKNKISARHDTLSEFLIENDPHHAFDRKISSSQLARDMIDEDFLEERCPMVLHINTQGGLGIYSKTLPRNTKAVLDAEWRHVDTGPAVALALQSVDTVPYVTPATHYLTFFEYKSSDDKFPRCAVALVNHKYTTTDNAPTQRITITGDDTFQPTLARQRMEDIRQGSVKLEDTLLGGGVPIKGHTQVHFRGSTRDHLKHSY